MEVQIKRMHEDVQLPEYAKPGDSGMDLRAYVLDMGYGPIIRLHSGDIQIIPTGIQVAIPLGYEGQIRLRSSLGALGLAIPNGIGTIDSGYRGELRVILMNLTHDTIPIEHGERIAQFIVAPVEHVRFKEVNRLPTSSRGEGGFGHTGRD